MVELTIVVPIYNEVENLERLYPSIPGAVRHRGGSYEILLLDADLPTDPNDIFTLMPYMENRWLHKRSIRFKIRGE